MLDGLLQRPGECGEAAIHKTFTTTIEVYWFDCDPAGIMYFGNFFKYFEIAEEELFASLGVKRAHIFEEKKIGFPRVESWARFRKPAPHGAVVNVTLWIEKRTEKSLLYCFEVRLQGKPDVIVEGSYWVVCIQRPEFRSIPMPLEVLDLLKDYLPPISRRSREHVNRNPHRDVAP
jgi:YbgC/YbaW family acyl-CoA thioester hydrolase